MRQETPNLFETLSQDFLAFLDAFPDALMLLSVDLNIQWVNQNVALALGKSMAELTGQPCWRFWNSEPARCHDCPAAKTLRTGNPERAQLSRPDGRIWEVSTFPLLDQQGQVRNIIERSRDVTTQVMMQAEAGRLAHLASLGEFAAEMAHEINNPINGIINYAQLLIDDVKMAEENAKIAGWIIKEGNRIATIVANVLSFAHAQSPEKTRIDLHALLADTLTLAGPQLKRDSVIVNVQMATGLSQVLGNYQQLEQVFLNLIYNARDALNMKYAGAAAGKILDIRGQQVMVKGHPHIRMTFHDRGVGIPAGLRHKVMQRFFSTKPRGLGTGLGLSISHGIVVDHGGSLVVESVKGEFTKVHVLLPGKVST